jgi:hypothetical protein
MSANPEREFDPTPNRPLSIGFLLFALMAIALLSKLALSIGKFTGSTTDLLFIINWGSFGMFWVVCIGWTIFSAISNVRFSLGKMLVVIWTGGACVTCIVASSKAEIIALGLFGLVILTAYLIAGVARAGIGIKDSED